MVVSPAATIPGMLSPERLAALMDGRIEGEGDRRTPLAGLCSDSRAVAEGGGFVALPGEESDGHRFVAAAASAGARLAVVREGWSPDGAAPPLLLRVPDTAAALRRACRARLDEIGATVVGVTGSVGKTTAKELCALALGSRRVAKTPGNLNTWTQIPLATLDLPDGVEVYVVEMAMSARGEIADLATFTRPGIGLFLNVGLAHIGLLGSQEAIADAKAELLDALPADGSAILNADDPLVRSVAGRSRAPIRWFGTGEDAQWRAADVELEGLRGSRLRVVTPQGDGELRLSVPGHHVVVDAVAAIAVAAACGVGLGDAIDGVAAFRAPEHRGEVVAGREGSLLYDDSYNSSPTSLEAALRVLAETPGGRRVAVVGDMLELGDEAPALHRDAGRVAAAACTDLVAVGDLASQVADGAVEAGLDRSAISVVADADEAARAVAPLLGDGTVVLVKASHGLHLERVVEALRA